MTTNPGYPAAPPSGKPPSKLSEAVGTDWARRIVDVVNGVLKGKVNAVLQITLTANSATTTVKDARITAYSFLGLQPLTTHAAAALYGAPYILPSNQENGQVTLNHANDASVDKTLNLLIIG